MSGSPLWAVGQAGTANWIDGPPADDIYREDITFRDPRNTFHGMKNYQTLFWSLRFHGQLFFSRLYVDVKRIWQPEDSAIKMRWTVHGVPRLPWQAEGLFDGISTYKLDHTGKIYEHRCVALSCTGGILPCGPVAQHQPPGPPPPSPPLCTTCLHTVWTTCCCGILACLLLALSWQAST